MGRDPGLPLSDHLHVGLGKFGLQRKPRGREREEKSLRLCQGGSGWILGINSEWQGLEEAAQAVVEPHPCRFQSHQWCLGSAKGLDSDLRGIFQPDISVILQSGQ